jgi:glycosyltransferase involved in cell wall biosynthesis
MLCNLLLRTDRGRFDVSVVALIDDMTVAGPVIEAGIPIVKLGMRPGMPEPTGVLRLMSHLRRVRPAVVQTWMDHSNLIGGVASRVTCGAKVVWGVHHSDHVKELTKRTTLLTVGACARLSRWVPRGIVLCSEHSRKLYGERGFAAEKMQVIPNGFDTARFRPDAAARAEVRRELGIAPDAPVVGLVARYDPFKDHAGFCRAAALVATVRRDARFVMCGRGVDGGNRALVSLIEALGIVDRCRLLGPRNDVPRVLAALDVLASSSVSEAFPLAVGEAMACGVPCVATDVGDSARMVGQAGRIVPAGNPLALAEGLNEVLAMDVAERARLGEVGRRRVREMFDLDAVTRRYEALYETLVRSPMRAAREREVVRDPGTLQAARAV